MSHAKAPQESMGQEEPISKAFEVAPGSDGFYLLAPGPGDEDVLMAQPEAKWHPEQMAAEQLAIAVSQRTGIALFVIRVVSKVIPWHQASWAPAVAVGGGGEEDLLPLQPGGQQWTSASPTVPGWYWHSVMGAGRCAPQKGPFAVLVEDDGGDALVGWVPTMDFTEPVTDTQFTWTGQWWGPIGRPPLPKISTPKANEA